MCFRPLRTATTSRPLLLWLATLVAASVGVAAAIQLVAAAAPFCSDRADRVAEHHRYHALAHCRRSNRTQVGLANYRRVERCAQLAHNRRALAFNYAPIGGRGARTDGGRNLYEKTDDNPNNYTIVPQPTKSASSDGGEFFNCQVLACPEWSDLGQMINDSRFDYYSMYTNPAPPPNATCLPTIGVFIYYNRFVNYSTAAQTCQMPHHLGGAAGQLATIMSAQRTNGLALVVGAQRPADALLDVAYVGLNQTAAADGRTGRTAGGHIDWRTAADEPIECFLFRAWAPGHPRAGGAKQPPRCVAITRTREWRAYGCGKWLPFVCEVFTSRPRRRLRLGGVCEGLPAARKRLPAKLIEVKTRARN